MNITQTLFERLKKNIPIEIDKRTRSQKHLALIYYYYF